MRLSEVMYSSTRTPLGMEINRLRDRENERYGRYLLSQYGKDPFASAVVEAIFERHPLMLMEFQEMGGFKILKEDAGSFLKGRGDASGMEYKGGLAGFMKNVGDRGKSILAGIGLKTYALTSAMGFHKDDKELQAEYEKMLAKYEVGAKHNLQALDKKIRGAIPDFPNNDKDDTKEVKAEDIGMKAADLEKATPHAVFLNGLGLIAAAYDGVVASHKSTDPEVKLSTAQANIIIDDLRVMLVKYSGELSSVYTQVENNEKMKLMPLLFEADEPAAGGGSKDVAAGGAAKLRGASKAGADTEETKANKSKVLPAVLALLGLGSIAASVVVGSPWFASLFQKTSTVTTPEQTREAVTGWQEETIATVTRENGGRGIMAFLNGMVPGTNLSVSASPKEFVDAVAKLGGGDYATGLQSLTQGGKGVLGQGVPGTYETLLKLGDNPNVYGNTFGDVIKHAGTGTHKTVGDMLQMDVGKITKMVPVITRIIVPASTTVIAGGAIVGAGTLALVSTALLATGVGLVVAGAAIYFLREKGLKSSRSAAIQGLKDIMVDVEERPDEKPGGGTPLPPPIQQAPPEGSPVKLKPEDELVVFVYQDKALLGWGDDMTLFEPIADGKMMEISKKGAVKPKDSDEKITTTVRKTVLSYVTQEPKLIKIKSDSGLKENDFVKITDACLKLSIKIVRFDEEGEAEETTTEGIEDADIPDEVVDDERKKKEKEAAEAEQGGKKKKDAESGEEGAGGDEGGKGKKAPRGDFARVDLSMRNQSKGASGSGSGGASGAGAGVAQESRNPSLASFLFEEFDEGAEVRTLSKKAPDGIVKKWEKVASSAGGKPLPANVPRIEKTFFDKKGIPKDKGQGLDRKDVGKNTVTGGLDAIRKQTGTKNVNLGFDTDTAKAVQKAIGEKSKGTLGIILKVYANSPGTAPSFDAYVAAFKKAKKGISDKAELERLLTQIGMVKGASKSKGKSKAKASDAGSTGTATAEPKLQESASVERWLQLAGLND